MKQKKLVVHLLSCFEGKDSTVLDEETCLKDFASLRLFSLSALCPASPVLEHRSTADTREGGEWKEGRACPCSSMGMEGSRTSSKADTRSVGRSVGWGQWPNTRRGSYSLRSGGICVKIWRIKCSL